MAMFHTTGLYRSYCRSKFYIAGVGTLDHFCLCDLDLDPDPMTFIYELDRCLREIYRMCESELPPTSVLLKLSYYRHTDRQTYIHTVHAYAIEKNYISRRFAGGPNSHRTRES